MLMFLQQIELSQIQAGALFGAILGFVIGLIPLILGIVKKKFKFGIIGFIGAIIGNTILGVLLSVPIIAICIYFIFQKDSPEFTAQTNTSDSSKNSDVS
jgi:hypothetical protein